MTETEVLTLTALKVMVQVARGAVPNRDDFPIHLRQKINWRKEIARADLWDIALGFADDALAKAASRDDGPFVVNPLDHLRAILPYAESRAEDMLEADGELDGADPSDATRKAVAAVDAAKALLESLNDA